MNHSEQIDQLATALSKAQSEIEGAVKNTVNPHFKRTYADLGSVWDAIREPLTKNGLSVAQFPSHSGDPQVMALDTVLMHSSGQWLRETFCMPVAKADPQGYGSAITYARRYSLMAVAGIAPVDDDGNEASKKPEPKQSPPPGGMQWMDKEPPQPKPVIVSAKPAERTADQWKAVVAGWIKRARACASVTELNNLQQELNTSGEFDALEAFNQTTMNYVDDKFNETRDALASFATQRMGAP